MTKLTKKIIKPQDKEIKLPARSRVLLLDYVKAGKTASSRKIIIGPHSRVQYVTILDPQSAGDLTLERELVIGDQASVDIFSAYFGIGNYQVNLNNNLGRSAAVTSRVLFWLKQKQVLKIQDNYIFTAPAASGKFKIEGLIDGEASAQYYSDVVIKPSAQETDSRIDMRLHLLSPTAQGNILPGLKIAANRVKAGHGASTFRLAPEDLFYLQSRGLSPEQIKFLVINSVANQFTATLDDSGVKDLLIKLIKERSV
jgi:Fe-S cluster assembly scaffold protein SufB